MSFPNQSTKYFFMELSLTGGSDQNTSYRVLARKYRPRDFSTLYGQEPLVKTLTNAISSGRLAHAFMLTGVRGVGKTTTARILARALNCSAPDVTKPTPVPCGKCENCLAILKDHHPDVLEMDAASHTGVDDIRELQKSVAYRPSLGRFKIFIIDEVHMLSTNAFNALLKTLEEPPEQVIFIFATTEIKKVPVTVLSRCQRFDLRRIDIDVLTKLFSHVIGEENLEAEAEALSIIARAADGSARDGLSILDQAISLSGSPLTAKAVQEMLGLADRAQILDLCELIMSGDVPKTLLLFDKLYQSGASPLSILTDLADFVHWMTRLKVGSGADDPGLSETARNKGQEMADALSIANLARSWQILSKSIIDVKAADHPKEAADMALIRLVYAGTLPTPDQISKKLLGAPLKRQHASDKASQKSPSDPDIKKPPFDPLPGSSGADPNVRAIHELNPDKQRRIESLEDIIEALLIEREPLLAADLRAYARVISIIDGNLILSRNSRITREHLNKLSAHLLKWTGFTWLVTLADGDGGPTLAEAQHAATKSKKDAAENHPLVQAALEAFPDAKMSEVVVID